MGVYSVVSPKRCNCSRWHSSDMGKPLPWHERQSHRVPAVLLAMFVWVSSEPGHQVCNQICYSLSLFIYCLLVRLAILSNLSLNCEELSNLAHLGHQKVHVFVVSAAAFVLLHDRRV